jgi:hypothetical protein
MFTQLLAQVATQNKSSLRSKQTLHENCEKLVVGAQAEVPGLGEEASDIYGLRVT